jgi:hypothetical protein
VDLFGRYTGGRHDTDPATASYSFARHGSGALAAFKRFCVSLVGRFVRIAALAGRRPTTVALTGRFVRTTALAGRRPTTNALTGRFVRTTPLVGRLGEC